MNTAAAPIDFEDYSNPIRLSAPLKPMPQLLDGEPDINDILFFQVPDVPSPPMTPTALPERRHPLLDTDRMVVPASLIRRIEQELRDDTCDPRTVFSACRGLHRGSRRFEEAYIAARIRSHSKHRRLMTDPLLGSQLNGGSQPPSFRHMNLEDLMPAAPHPMAVLHLGHLMRHFGIWVVALIGVQIWASWRIAVFANEFLEGGSFFYLGICLVLMLALDSCVWFRRRGNLSAAFIAPGAILFGMALLPAFTLHLRQILMALDK